VSISRAVLSTAWLTVSIALMPLQAGILTFNSIDPSGNAASRSSWLAAIGIATPQYLVDFESGFVDGQNISDVTGLFPAGLVIGDWGPAHQAVVRSGAGVINGSNPVGVFSVTQNEQPFLVLDFRLSPVDYVAFQDIDHAGATGLVVFLTWPQPGSSAPISFETTGGFGDTAEFFGIFRNDMPRIIGVLIDVIGDDLWGIDTIEYGVVPEPGSFLLAAAGLAGLGLLRRRRAQR